MKGHVKPIIIAIVAGAGAAYASTNETVTVNAIDAGGIGKEIGTLGFLRHRNWFAGDATPGKLPPGDHGFHVHVNPNCGPGNGPSGQPAAGMAAGGHYDPANTGKHLGPLGAGHKGDLPALTVDADGRATKDVVAPHLKVSDLKSHSIMIHGRSDTTSDQPAPLGGGGARIACGVTK